MTHPALQSKNLVFMGASNPMFAQPRAQMGSGCVAIGNSPGFSSQDRLSTGPHFSPRGTDEG